MKTQVLKSEIISNICRGQLSSLQQKAIILFFSVLHADIIIQELSNYLSSLHKVSMKTGIDTSYQIQDQESLEEVGTLPLQSNSTAEIIKQTWMQKGCLPDSTGNRKVKQVFLNKLSFQEHEQQQFLFINQSQEAPPNYPFLCSPLLQLCPPCKQEISIIYTYTSVRSSAGYEKNSVQKYIVQSLNLF